METGETDSSAAAAPSSAPAYPPAWLRGFLPAAVLAVVARGQTYGYAIAQDLDAAGLGHIKGGTLYPVLTGLERDGLLEATWSAGQGGPGRKLLTLTPAGRERLKEYRRQWADFTGAVGALLGGVLLPASPPSACPTAVPPGPASASPTHHRGGDHA